MLLHAKGRSRSRMLTGSIFRVRTTFTRGTPISMRLTICLCNNYWSNGPCPFRTGRASVQAKSAFTTDSSI